jgi:UDPglucose--hexose-1-phosphate uridylyltransferase
MKLKQVVKVPESPRKETQELSENPNIKSVLIFENKGEAVGVSNAHPHCQIYATDFPLKLVEQQINVATDYQRKHNQNIFHVIIENEQRDKIRVLAENDHAIAFIPFFARYAYEVMIFPKGNHQQLTSLGSDELTGLASVFHQVVRRMDMNFNMDFPYVMSVMQAPVDGGNYKDFRMHLWLQPPYRQPGLIKYLAGPEIGAGNFMADTMPEDKAAELLSINLTDYSLER